MSCYEVPPCHNRGPLDNDRIREGKGDSGYRGHYYGQATCTFVGTIVFAPTEVVIMVGSWCGKKVEKTMALMEK